MGYTIVLMKLADGSRRKTLTLMAERADDVPMSFDDCAEISRMAGALLEVDDPITDAYDLEVCSPGIDRPLTRLGDFDRYANYEARIETLIPIDGRKRFKGVIKGTEGEIIILTMQDGEARIDFNSIRSAKLVMTDALVEAHLKQQKKKVKG
jgi:ribosome maturation factor RimP